jgi:hypothetical protein
MDEDILKQTAQIAALAIAQRNVAWSLIDRLIPYVRDAPPTDKGEQIDWYIDKVDLLAEIEQKRAPHG